jgi:hypothetical protein
MKTDTTHAIVEKGNETATEIFSQCCSSSNIRMINSRWLTRGGHTVRVNEMRNAYKILVGKSGES